MSSSPYRLGLWLEYFTVGYNVIEAIVALSFGQMAGSIALISFGLDSIVESLSGTILIWRLRQHEGLSPEREAAIERRAEQFVAITFWVLGAYVLWQAMEKLRAASAPGSSWVGIGLAIASLIVMPALARAKHRVGRQLGSRALLADAKETLACAWLSAALLLGLMGNAVLGFWQADPLASLAIVAFLLREGWKTWNDED